jgi:transposase
MNQVVPWSELLALVEPVYPRAGNGRQTVGLAIMLRTYFLQQWFGFSDPGMEEAFYDSPVLQRFAGVDLGMAAAPDETTILRFRHLLEQHDLCGQMLDTVNRYLETKGSLPIQRGNVKLQNIQVLNAILYVAEQGCKWRGLPSRFGNWHSIYTRMNRWAKSGVLDRVFEKLQTEQIVRIKIEAFSLDSTSIKVHPDGTGALKKTAHRQSANPAVDGTPRFIWLPQMLERL